MGYAQILAADETTQAIGVLMAKIMMIGGLGGAVILIAVAVISSSVRRGMKDKSKP